MRRLVFVLLVSCLLFPRVVVQEENIFAVKASSSIHQGDLILTGNNVTVIENRKFEINGSIIVEENATLILNNVVVNLIQTMDFQHRIRFASLPEDTPSLQATDVMITSNHRFIIWFYYNSSATISNCTISEKGGLTTWYSSYLYAVELKAEAVVAYMSSTMYLVNSDVGYVCNSGPVTVWLVNSTYDHIVYLESQSEPIAYVCWFLEVHVVDSIGQDVPLANVTVYRHTGTMMDSELTSNDGLVNFIVPEKVIRPPGHTTYGNYTIKTTYDDFCDQTTVNMTDNKQITLTLEDFVIPEFPYALILPLFMIATLLAVIIYRREHTT
jgi:hypothetical protein